MIPSILDTGIRKLQAIGQLQLAGEYMKRYRLPRWHTSALSRFYWLSSSSSFALQFSAGLPLSGSYPQPPRQSRCLLIEGKAD